jgi:hypothetical protein
LEKLNRVGMNYVKMPTILRISKYMWIILFKFILYFNFFCQGCVTVNNSWRSCSSMRIVGCEIPL